MDKNIDEYWEKIESLRKQPDSIQNKQKLISEKEIYDMGDRIYKMDIDNLLRELNGKPIGDTPYFNRFYEEWEKQEREKAERQKKNGEKENMLDKIEDVEIKSVCRYLFNSANLRITNIHKEEDTNTVVVDCINLNSINSITITVTINSGDVCR